MITRLTIRNYRSLLFTDIKPKRLTVLAGPNGSGKSNLIDALRFVRDAFIRGTDRAVTDRHGINEIRPWKVRDDVSVHFHFDISDWSGEYGFSLGGASSGEYRVTREKYVITSRKTDDTDRYEIRDGQWLEFPDLFSPDRDVPGLSDTELVLPVLAARTGRGFGISEYFGKMRFYTIAPDKLRVPQKPGNPYPLDEHGRNLCAALKHIKSRGENVSRLLDALRVVVPDAEDYAVDQIGGYLVTRILHTPVNGEKPAFELAHESEGTLRILGILTALYQTPQIPLLAIEEPELNIHPGVMRILRDVLLEVSAHSQVIITTHSPDLISDLPPDVLMILEKDRGITRIGPISQTQHQAVTEKLFWPGELMRIEGLRRETGN